MKRYTKIVLLFLCAVSYSALLSMNRETQLEEALTPFLPDVLVNMVADYALSSWLSPNTYELEITFMSEEEKKKHQVTGITNLCFELNPATQERLLSLSTKNLLTTTDSYYDFSVQGYSRIDIATNEENTSHYLSSIWPGGVIRKAVFLTNEILLCSYYYKYDRGLDYDMTNISNSYIAIYDLTNPTNPQKIHTILMPEQIKPIAFKISQDDTSTIAILAIRMTDRIEPLLYTLLTLKPKRKKTLLTTQPASWHRPLMAACVATVAGIAAYLYWGKK